MAKEHQNRMSPNEFLNYIETKKTKIVYIDWHKWWEHFHIWIVDNNAKTYVQMRIFSDFIYMLGRISEMKIDIFAVDDHWRQ